jgi:hypothetical protein
MISQNVSTNDFHDKRNAAAADDDRGYSLAFQAFDVWFGTCAAFILVSITESVAVESMTRRGTKRLMVILLGWN